MASKRNRQRSDGSISWEARYRVGGRATSVVFETCEGRDEWVRAANTLGLDAALEILAAQQGDGGRVPTLRQYALADVELRAKASEGTKHRYRREIENDWGRLGHLPINAVSENAVRGWVRDMQRRGVSAKTIHNKHGFMSSVFAAAMRDRDIDLTVNPCAHTDLPEVEEEEMVFLTRDEFVIFLGCFPEPWRPFIHTLFMTGQRFSEITALWKQHYLPSPMTGLPPELRVAQAWKKVPGGWELGAPKTRKGRRSIPISAEVEADVLAQLDGKGPEDLIFTTPRGGRIKHSTFYPDVWVPAVRLANGKPGWPEKGKDYSPTIRSAWHGIEPASKRDALGKFPRIHDARHTAASWLLELTGDIHAVQEALGHESIQTTVDRYGHLLPSRRVALAAAMGVASSQARPLLDPA